MQRNWLLILVALGAIAFGYMIGKDRALRDNRADTPAVTQTQAQSQPGAQDATPTADSVGLRKARPESNRDRSRSSDRSQGNVDSIAYDRLPREAHQVLRDIATDGPYDYSRDGTTFQNRERLLPQHERGYYREFTVRTPGSKDRGARRIVTGGKPPTEYYYTDDHYRSFSRITEIP